MVKISHVLTEMASRLSSHVSFPRQEAEILLAYVLKKDKLWLIVHKDNTLESSVRDKVFSLLEMRLNGMPMAYITGTKEFMSLEFCVNENVLIPRPETEELVTYIIDLYKSEKNLNILDLCTGSGAICCSLAYYMESSACTGVDISHMAIETAKANASKLGVEKRCIFKEADVLKAPDFAGSFDIVVSNPPYIETEVIASLDECVKDYEPLIALDGGDDGLIFYKSITDNIESYLKTGGMLFFEIGYNQGEKLKALMSQKFTDIKIIKDLSGHDRIACGRLKP